MARKQTVFEKRRAKLAAFLNRLNPEGFRMRWWITLGNTTIRNLRAKLLRAKSNQFECGMAACVGGWTAVLFPKQLKINDEYQEIISRVGGFTGSSAVAKALGISFQDAENLCDANAPHQTPKEAAAFLRTLKDAPSI